MINAINRKSFRVSACVDWLKVVIQLSSPSQHRHIKAALDDITGENLFAEPLDADPNAGGNAMVFAITFHDRLANDLLALNDAIDRLRSVHTFASEPTIGAIEVACDWYWRGPPTTQVAGLLAITRQLQGSLYAPGAKSPRQFVPNGGFKPNGKPDGTNRYLDNKHERHRLDPSLNFRIGNKSDDLSWQAYFKTTDKNQTPIHDHSQWRARVEVTIRGDALRRFGLNSLTDLDGYDFQKLMPLFRFRRPVDPLTQARNRHKRIANPDRKAFIVRLVAHTTAKLRQVTDATPERGIHSFEAIGRTAKRNRTRAESSHIEKDPVLSGAAKGALRRLSLGRSYQKKGTNSDGTA